MKKILSFFLSIILLSIPSFATAKSEERWYFSSKNQNERPGLPQLDEIWVLASEKMKRFYTLPLTPDTKTEM